MFTDITYKLLTKRKKPTQNEKQKQEPQGPNGHHPWVSLPKGY